MGLEARQSGSGFTSSPAQQEILSGCVSVPAPGKGSLLTLLPEQLQSWIS